MKIDSDIAPPAAIAWFKVSGLVILQGAISLCWLIYNLYLPKLLVQLGFPVGFGLTLLAIENLLAVGMEPLMGSLSDQSRHWWGSRFPMIALGIGSAAVLFLCLPISAIGGTSALRGLLPVLAVAWALAMTVFRSPALSLLGQFALQSRLPQAASLLSLMGAFVGAVNLIASQTILTWGAVPAFAIGSAVLILAAFVLHYLQVEESPTLVMTEPQSLNWSNLIWLFGMGIGICSGARLLMIILQASPVNVFAIPAVGLFTTLHMLALFPAGWLASRWENRPAMISGIVLLCLALPLLGAPLFGQQAGGLLAIALTAVGLSFLANGTLPLAIASLPKQRAGLGIGIFFGGVALANSGLAAIGAQINSFGIPASSLCAGLSFLGMGLCLSQVREG